MMGLTEISEGRFSLSLKGDVVSPRIVTGIRVGTLISIRVVALGAMDMIGVIMAVG
ncbi:MAG: hypothetical protein QW461_08185 [Candidatus Jordarchaeales archaeon]